MTRPTRPFATALSLSLSLALLAGLALPAASQEVRTTTVHFASASASQNGYLHGTVRIRYAFDGCGDIPQLFLALEAGSTQGYEGYWYEGKFYGLQSGWQPPATPPLTAPLRVHYGARQVPVSDLVNPYVSPTSCFSGPQYRMLGQWKDFIPAGEDREAAIQRFTLDIGSTRAPLRSETVERAIRTQLAAAAARARADSTARAASERARTDSVARADAARRAAAAAASGSAGSASGTAAAGAAGASAASTATQRQRDAERDEENRRLAAAEAAAQRDRDAEHARRVEAERLRVQAEQEQQLVEAVEVTTVAALGLIEAIADSRRASAEKKRVQAERARREADARYAAYVATTKARFEAAPARPACTARDIRDSLVLSMRTERRTLRLTGDECRLAQGQSAILILLVVDADAPVVLTPSSSPVIANLHMLEEGTNRALSAQQEGPLAWNVPRGRYVLVVSSRLPGEVGDVTLSARKGWVSDAQGSLGGAAGPAQRIDGFVGTNATSSAFMDLNLNLQHRRGLPYLTMTLLMATDTEAAEGMFDVGLRQYLGPSTARVAPWIEASIGYRSINVLQEPFTTISPAFGAGVAYRFNAGYGLALSATQITGKARNTENIWTSTPPDVPLNRTIVRLGLMIY